MKSPEDPVDHARTTRPHAGETMKDTKNMPALVLLGVALVAFVSALAAHATSNHTVGVILGCISAVVLLVSGAWFMIEHRRVRNIEERWHAEHPGAQPQRPSA
ncbi:LapA family protein [Mycobacterium sp. PS03-16]|uniref:protein UsfY n=1 Tax=Mycobacterium sp. PS03-16 TaxID=2559611 RepID=UPI0010735CA3|nr:protein UsfY [Mycobacterium sp. PS03-16]TFV58616.1 LapA family protein [Mycobacterium sp. PS03-16]